MSDILDMTTAPLKTSAAKRIYLVARRDFLGYVKTIGFWITVLSPFLGLGFGIFASSLSLNSDPVRYATIIDETGRFEGKIEARLQKEQDTLNEVALKGAGQFLLTKAQKDELDALMESGGLDAGRAYMADLYPDVAASLKLPESKLKLVAPPAPTLDALMPYIKGERDITVDGATQKLSGVLQFYDDDEGTASAKYWTTNASAKTLRRQAERVLRDDADERYFANTGLSSDEFFDNRDAVPDVEKFDPTKEVGADGEGQSVSVIDQIPLFVAAGFSAFLWLAVFSGAYMLLMSMVEEKINKALEMLLASTRFTEILMGKLLGVAALTIASLAPWLIMGAAGLIAFMKFGDGAVAAAILSAMTPQLIFFFILFFVLGYIFYGSLFMALGSLAESMQDSQTLVTPILILLTLCVMVVPIGIESPDSNLLRVASFIPFSAPFAMIIRLPSDPPLWEVLLSCGILLASAVFVVWLAAKLFRYGVLSGGGMAGVKAWFAKTILRKKTIA